MLQLKQSLRTFMGLSLICGLIYPLAITFTAQILFSEKASGSIIKNGHHIMGSRLIGQHFSSPEYFHGRPSTTDSQYDASNSGGSNLAPSSAKLIAQAHERVQKVRTENGLSPNAPVPADLVLTSASGLDPHISPESAAMQIPRIAAVRKIPETKLEKIIQQKIERPLLGIWGKERVNVLILNIALDSIEPKH